MKEVTRTIGLQTNDSSIKLLFATRYLVQINYTFDLTAKSSDFSGTSHFCVRTDEIEAFCNDLMVMHASFSGSAQLSDNDSDGFVRFQLHDSGHLSVSGQVGGSHEDHYMTFEFLTDQTCIPPFVADFKALLNNDN
jgi:hypothetical protein